MSAAPQDGYVPCGVWRIRGAHNIVYLAGTSHIVPTNEIPFPSAFYAAYADATEIYVEVDSVSIFTTLRLMPKILKWTRSHQAEMVCAKGQTLESNLAPRTVERLRELYGPKYEKRQHLTPLAVLFFHEFEGAETGGVDDVFTLLAHRDRKPIRELDDKTVADSALLMLDEMLANWRRDIAKRGADAVIAENILGEKKEASDDESLWRRGDLAAVEQMQAEMRTETPVLYQKGLVERNHQWMRKLQAALQEKKNLMVLVGVGHLGGKEGLLELLRAQGFQPEQLYGVDRPE
jgi:uncharacterized protein YbaP (TraB family)